MQFRALLVVGVTMLAVLAGCGTSSPTVATVGGDQMTVAEFEEQYAKNNGGWEAGQNAPLAERQKFLDLLVKFRLKVKEARARGLDRDSAVMSEIALYRSSVAQTFMTEKELLEPNIRRFFDRKNQEVRASHILLRLAPAASPAETLEAYNKALRLIARLESVSFDSLARINSEDPSASFNGGDLGFFSGGRMVPEFEDICFSLQPGEYTKSPVRTQFGYHIVKVTARQPNPGAVHIAHALFRFSQDMHDTTSVTDSANAAYALLKEGAAFDQVVTRFSQDPGSVARGGDIGFYERERLPPSLGMMLYSAKPDSILPPFRMNYGYHIFKVMGFSTPPTFEESEKDVRTQYQQQRYQADYRRFVDHLQKLYPVTMDSAAIAGLVSALDSTKSPAASGWGDTLTAAQRSRTLMTAGKSRLTAQDFVDRVSRDTEVHNQLLNGTNIRTMLKKQQDALVIDEHARVYAERNPSFMKLMQEYEDGILLYRIEQDEVWQKVSVTDSLLQEYYDSTKASYRWPDRVNFAEIFVTTDSAAQACAKAVNDGKDFADVAAEQTARPGFKEKKGVWGFQAVTANELSQRAAKMEVDEISEPFKYQYGWSIIKTLALDSARTKTFQEAAPEVATGFQEKASKEREREWIDGLRKKYPVTIDADALANAFTRKKPDAR